MVPSVVALSGCEVSRRVTSIATAINRINPDASGFKSANRRALPKLCTRNLNAGQVLHEQRGPMSANAARCDNFDENGGSKHHLPSPAVSLAIAVAANTNVVPVNSLARQVERTQLRTNPNSDYSASAFKLYLRPFWLSGKTK